MVTYWRRDYIHGLMFHACGTNVYVDIKIVLEVSEIRAINNHYLLTIYGSILHYIYIMQIKITIYFLSPSGSQAIYSSEI